MKKSSTLRVIFYVAGLLVLALGIILNTKSGLGVSPIISVSYSISTIWNLNFGNMTFVLYTAFVIVEMILHTIWNHREAEDDPELKPAAKKSLPLILGMDLLQLPLSLIFTRFMNLFSGGRHHLYRYRSGNVTEYAYHSESWRWNRSGNCGLYS